jgi:hypothetical protein
MITSMAASEERGAVEGSRERQAAAAEAQAQAEVCECG